MLEAAKQCHPWLGAHRWSLAVPAKPGAQTVPSLLHPRPLHALPTTAVRAGSNTGPCSAARYGDALGLCLFLTLSGIAISLHESFNFPPAFLHLQPSITAHAEKAVLKPLTACSTALMNKCHRPRKCE